MDHREVGRYWDGNADAWTKLSRAGYDTYRDAFNTPAFLEMLPDVEGMRGLDIGCGEGYNTRQVAELGARMTAFDISTRFVQHARDEDSPVNRGIHYLGASAVELPFADVSFDFVTSFMCLMDVPEADRALKEAFRVLKPGGFIQFSILHPSFDTPHRKQVRDSSGKTIAFEIAGYFHRRESEMAEWTFSAAPPEDTAGLPLFRTPYFKHPLSEWLNFVIDAGFTIERLGEPYPNDEIVRRCPNVQDAQVTAYFLHVRGRKMP